jgi:hypothetical protein
MGPRLLIMLLYVATGLVLAALSAPLILHKIPPNPFYGFRLPKTMNNPDIWYDINAYGGWRLLIAGLISSAVAAGLYYLAPGLSMDVYALTLAGVTVLALGIGIGQSLVRLSKM